MEKLEERFDDTTIYSIFNKVNEIVDWINEYESKLEEAKKILEERIEDGKEI